MPSWRDLPTSILSAELARRAERPACGSEAGKHGYNTPAHVVALFIILLLSTLGEDDPQRTVQFETHLQI
jgi:solute carrier family 39 (zinc transporter), member 1/2/3